MNPVSLMSLCSHLAGMRDPESIESRKLGPLIASTFEDLKQKTLITFFNSLVRVRLQSEKTPTRYLQLILWLLSETLDLEQVVIVSKQGSDVTANSVSLDGESTLVEADQGELSANFEASFNFLKLRVFTSDAQKSIIQTLGFASHSPDNLLSVAATLERKGPSTDLIGFFSCKGKMYVWAH